MRDIRDELLDYTKSRPVIRVEKHHAIIFGVVLFFAIYVYHLLYGNNSLLRLIELKEDSELISKQIEKITNENAELKKYIYEIKIIKGEE